MTHPSPPSRSLWESAAADTLGRPTDSLIHHTLDGLAIRPLYARDDIPETNPGGAPGKSPYTRGNLPDADSLWHIRQRHAGGDPLTANRNILHDLNNGANAITLDTGQNPAFIDSLAALQQTLNGVHLNLAPVGLDAGSNGSIAAAMLAATWEDKKTIGSLDLDPLGALTAEGRLPGSISDELGRMAEFATLTQKTWPDATSVMVSTRPVHDGGASDVQELAVMLATGIAYLTALTDAGLSLNHACRQISFRLVADTRVFFSVAKIRAARRLWNHATQTAGADDPARIMALHVETSARILSRNDPWTNIIRNTAACFAAALTGPDSITTHPFTDALGTPDPLARRSARNIQLILQQETDAASVADPVGGSWFVESLTDQMARAAWEKFQSIESGGGLIAALTSGRLQKDIIATRKKRDQRIIAGEQPIVGVTIFPPPKDDMPVTGGDPIPAQKPARPGAAVGSSAAALIGAARDGATAATLADAVRGDPAQVDPLPARRLSDAVESP